MAHLGDPLAKALHETLVGGSEDVAAKAGALPRPAGRDAREVGPLDNEPRGLVEVADDGRDAGWEAPLCQPPAPAPDVALGLLGGGWVKAEAGEANNGVGSSEVGVDADGDIAATLVEYLP